MKPGYYEVASVALALVALAPPFIYWIGNPHLSWMEVFLRFWLLWGGALMCQIVLLVWVSHMNPILTIILVAVIAALTLNSFRLQSEIDKLRRLYLGAMNALAAQQSDLDERDAEIERLRAVRCEYVQHLIASNARSVPGLRRESWLN